MTVSGSYAGHAIEQTTRGTIGEGIALTVTDEKNSTPEDTINRDTTQAQVITKNQSAGVQVYVSTNAVKQAIGAVETVGKTLSQISTNVFTELGKQGNKAFEDLAKAKDSGKLTDTDIIRQLNGCNGQQGFNIFNFLISTAHASGTCTVKTSDGKSIPFTGDDRQRCLEAYIELTRKDPTAMQTIVKGLTLTRAFAEPIGNISAIFGEGPVIVGTDANGDKFGATDSEGRMLYKNKLTGQYFFSDPTNHSDQVMLETSFGLASIFAGTSAASRVNLGSSVFKPIATVAEERFGPTNPGPLTSREASSFRSGSYTQVTTAEPVTLYRVWGGQAGELGSYWTTVKPTGPLQAQMDLALKAEWGNTASSLTKIQVPAGQTVFQGIAAPQGWLPGGAVQIYVPNVNPN